MFRNLKVGTYHESSAWCGQKHINGNLWTPNLCVNKTEDAKLSLIAEEAMYRIMTEDQSVAEWKLVYFTATKSFREGLPVRNLIQVFMKKNQPSKDSGQVLNDLTLTALLMKLEKA